MAEEVKVVRSQTIWDIVGDAFAIDQMIEEHAATHEGDITGVEKILDDFIAQVAVALDGKADSYIRYYKALLERLKARQSLVDGLEKLIKQDKAIVEGLKYRLKTAMEVQDRKTIHAPSGKANIQGNGGLAPLVITCEVKDLPEEFQKVTVDFDKVAIREALEGGKKVPGCKMGERGTRLVIS
jgi:hypothetical protein